MSFSHVGVLDAVRTPRGIARATGALHALAPVQLLAQLLRAGMERVNVDDDQVVDGVFGCVTQTGAQGGNIGKTACLVAGLSPHMSAVTINRYCASGLSAVNWAAQQARDLEAVTLAGGVEMMSRVPMLSDDGPLYRDPETVQATGFMPISWMADMVATQHDINRADCDEYAATSQQRAAAANARPAPRSLLPVRDAQGAVLLARDETVRPATTVQSLAGLKPLHADDAALDQRGLGRFPQVTEVSHVHTVGNAPCPADGAAVVMLAPEGLARRNNWPLRARILAHADACVPNDQTGAVPATRRALQRAGLSPAEVDLWEVRDSFAAVTLHYLRAFDIPLSRFNVNGSSIALGHPMGATGAMLVSCLLDEMEARGLRYGVVAIAGAAGVATATVFESLQKN